MRVLKGYLSVRFFSSALYQGSHKECLENRDLEPPKPFSSDSSSKITGKFPLQTYTS